MSPSCVLLPENTINKTISDNMLTILLFLWSIAIMTLIVNIAANKYISTQIPPPLPLIITYAKEKIE
jgi:hypothetical protein